MSLEQEITDKLAVLVGDALAFFKEEGKILCIVMEYRNEVKYFETFLIKGNRVVPKEKMDREEFRLCDFLDNSISYISEEFKKISEKYNGEFPTHIKILCNVETRYFYNRFHYDNPAKGEEVMEFLKNAVIIKHNINTVKLSEVIKEYKELTKKECYGIEVIEDEIPDILDDKIGGTPYLPVGVEWPEGMNLLLQVNLKNIELEHFPKEGILEIFVSSDCDSPCETKVFIFDEGLEYQTDLPEQDMDEFFVTEALKIKLEKVIEHMPINNDEGNKKFCDMIKKYFDFQDEEIEIEEFAQLDYYEEFFEDQEDVEAYNNIDDGVTKANIGGYPAYTQENEGMFDLNEDICIFKLDSYLNDSVNIGDSGILNITMSMEDFKKRDFSNVSGYWDCL
jgi:uncharacterized protein YwqG